MATSSDTTFELTRNNIIEMAMRKGGRLGLGVSASATELTNGQLALNALIAELQTKHGMPLWSRRDYSITLVASQRDYTIGDGQTINTPFPLKIHSAHLETITGGAMREVFPVAYKDFRNLNTESTGIPVSYSYQPRINLGILSLWPLPTAAAASDYTLQITYQRPFDGFTGASETPDFPQEWQNTLVFGLAWSMASEWGVPIDDRKLLKAEFDWHLDSALDGAEQTSIYFQRDGR